MADTLIQIDSLLPPEMAVKAEGVGVKKSQLSFATTFALAVLAGAFIALGALFCTTVTAPAMVDGVATSPLPFGVSKLLGGLVFCLGLILVVVAGAELFTGNNLIVMAWANNKVPFARLLRNWVIVYLGNFVGSLATVVVVLLSKQYTFGGGMVGLNALNIASSKSQLGFIQAIALGIMCNALVCLAVWLTFSARSTTDKILSIIFPISAFVAAGFEHSVANMYFIPMGLFIKWFDPAFTAQAAAQGVPVAALNLTRFLAGNLLPVTLGNIIGGAGMVGLVYWFIYLRPKKVEQAGGTGAVARR